MQHGEIPVHHLDEESRQIQPAPHRTARAGKRPVRSEAVHDPLDVMII
jgi:hypothetical protein